VLDSLDLVLVMTVNPGFGGQSFIESCLPKIERIASAVERRKLRVRVEVDGGITAETASRVTAAGATVLVAGTAVFGKKSYGDAIAALRTGGEAGLRSRDASREP
jgi:ribulose-phosphate 3-epimerase